MDNRDRPKHRGAVSAWIPAVLGLAGLTVACIIQREALADPSLIHNDARIHIWWMTDFSGNNCFENDALAALMAQKSWRNPGFVLLFQAFAPWLSPFVVSKCLSIIMLPLTMVLIVWLGTVSRRRNAGAAGALVYCALALKSWSGGLVVFDGLQRSFRDPILILGLVALARPSKRLFVFACLLACLFYPICLPVLVLTMIIKHAFFMETHSGWIKAGPKPVAVILLMTVLAAILWSAIYYYEKPFCGYCGAITGNPRYGAGGREPIFGPPGNEITLIKPFLIAKSTGILGNKSSEARTVITLLLLCGMLWVRSRDRQMPHLLISFLLSGLLLYLLAWVLAFVSGRFPLYFPSRFNVLRLCLVIGFGRLLTGLPDRRINKLIAVGACLLILIPRIASVEYHPGYVRPEPWEEALFASLESTPGREVIAGPPDYLNNVSSFACASVYVSFEMHTEMRSDTSRQRFYKNYDMLYAETMESVYRLAETEGVTHVLLDRRMIEDSTVSAVRLGIRRVYLEPYRTYVREKLKDQTRFAFRSVPAERIVFSRDPVYLINVQR